MPTKTTVASGVGCPNPAALQGLLDESLKSGDRGLLGAHVGGCARCRGTLAALEAAAVGVTWASLPAAKGPHTAPLHPPATQRLRWQEPPPAARPDVPGYAVLEEIGSGGMGLVFRARHRLLNRVVAIKMLLDGRYASPELRLRFRIEAEAVARLQHPGIVQVFEFGEVEGWPYLVMEYLPGGALDDLLLAGRQLTPAVAASLVADVADAVAAAHRAGVIHRDLKPANILLGEPWDAGGESETAPRVKVADFGLAKLDQFDVTRQGVLVGTPAYMAPEQASGRPGEVGTATDIWALGVVLYELLAGRRPFPSENPAETLMALTHAEPEALRQANPAVPRDLETICRKCLAKAPAQRYRTADALADDLRAFLEGRPIAARPTQAWEHAARLARRHPVPAAALVILVAGLAGAFGWVNAARVRETAARQAADERERQAKVALAGADATLHFFEDKLLSAAGPKGAGGGLDKDVTLREAITAALPDLATRFTDQPVVESRLRRTVGAAFRNLGDAAVALGQFERAAALSAEHLGPDDPHTLACRDGLALTYRALNRDEEAVKLHEEVLAARRRVLGPDHRDTLASLHSLAASLFALKRYPDALRIEEEALAGRRRVLGPDHPDLLKSGNLMAAILSRVDRHAESVTLLEESLAAHRRVMGPDDPATLMAVHNLAYAYCLSQRLPESLRLLEECVAGRRRVLPPDHPHLLISVALLAKSLGDAGRGAEAVPLIDEYLALTAGKPADPNILPVLIKRRLRHFEAHCDAAGCRATAELFEKRNRPEANQFYLAARLRAVTAAVAASAGSPSDGAIDADRAMAWLTKAAAAGYSSRDGVSDFAALRGRADYQALAKPKGP